jgi:VanZ family protein
MTSATPAGLSRRRVLQFLGFAALVLLAIVAAHLFEPRYWSRNAKSFVKTFHAPGFAVVALVFLGAFRRQGMGRRSYLYAALAALAAGVVSEVAQLASSRNADVGDLLRDVIGICAGLGLAATFDPLLRARRRGGWLVMLVVGTGAAIIASFGLTVQSGHALWSRNTSVPTLMTFAHRWERFLYEEAGDPTSRLLTRPVGWPATADDVVLWTESTGRFNTLLHLRPYPDWRGYGALSFVAASADENARSVNVNVWDTPPDSDQPLNRFNRRIEVTPEPQRFTIHFEEIAAASTERPFDFEHVDIVILFLRGEERGALLLDDFRLERYEP